MSKSTNSNLHGAKAVKNDEFYTQLTDIEKELKHYKKHFKNKVVFLNCDDPQDSQFWFYFAANFEFLGLKKLIATHYNANKSSYKLEIERDVNGDGKVNDLDTIKTPLNGDGAFSSDECVALLVDADVVVTNPPFSLFREYITLLIEHNKKFIVIGNKNAFTYKEIFPLIKDDKVWMGNYSPKNYRKPDGSITKNLGGLTRWFTNLTIKKRYEDIILYKAYKGNNVYYPKYENYNAINIDKVKDIPVDYMGAMGVPITFLDKYNPKQFEIIGLGISDSGLAFGVKPYKVSHRKYRRDVQKCGAANGDLYMMVNSEVKVPYARIIIKRK